MKEPIKNDEELRFVKKYAKLLDSKFTIPGTKISFGIDPVVGMIPVVGDIVGYGFSVIVLFSAIKKGAKGEVLAKMLINIVLDALIGLIPILGTLFDFFYKANDRNYRLLNEFVEEGKHTGSAKPYIIGVILFVIMIFSGLIWLAFAIISWALDLIF